MAIQLGHIAPDFEQDSTQGRVRFHDWLGSSWGVLFSHPKNFTPVCTTELGEVAKLRPEWDKRNVKPIGLSIDRSEEHTSELQSLMRISYAVFCLKKKQQNKKQKTHKTQIQYTNNIQ